MSDSEPSSSAVAATPETDAGEAPSQPLFKKRTVKAKSRLIKSRSTSTSAGGTPDREGSVSAADAVSGTEGASSAAQEDGCLEGGAVAREGEVGDEDEEDESFRSTLADMVALRAFKKAHAGIELSRLNKGDPKKKKKKKKEGEGQSGDVWNITTGGLVDKSKLGGRGEEDEEAEDDEAKARRLVRSNNFTQQTNTLDVDKHMMAYIEQELRKRRGGGGGGKSDDEEEEGEEGEEGSSAAAAPEKPFDPQDELYRISEKYRTEKKEVEEGNVTLSSGMLTSIPEVDLGMDSRLKNIEETEKAKRKLYEERAKRGGSDRKEEEHFAAERFFRPRHQVQSDADALRKARLEASGRSEPDSTQRQGQQGQGQQGQGEGQGQGQWGQGQGQGQGHRRRDEPRREMATDDLVMDRFKKRMRR